MPRPLRWLVATGLSCAFLTAPGCGPLDAADNLPGTYRRTDKIGQPGYLQALRLTEDKCIMAVPLAGEVARGYTVDHHLIYVGGPDGQLIFRIDGPDIISNRGLMGVEGTYVKEKK